MVVKETWVYEPGGNASPLPWGPYSCPAEVNLDGIKIRLEERDKGFMYHRNGAGENVEKLVLSKKGKLYLSPVEPVNKPLLLSSHLLIEITAPILVEPHSTRSIFLEFPVEIAVSVGRRETGENIIDIFTNGKNKHTLYGNVKDGVICKYWRSDPFSTFPKLNPLEAGVLQLEIQNPGAGWVEVSKTVLSAYGMKIYYGGNLVTLNAVMKIINDNDAETSFIDSPLQPGLTAAAERYSTRLLTQQGKMLMEEGY